MNKIVITIILIILNASNIHADLYNELFMKDFSINLGAIEHFELTFNTEKVEKGEFRLMQTDTLSEIFYYEACPFLVSHAIIKHFFELVSLAKNLIESDNLNYEQIFKTLPIENTILENKQFIETLSIILKQIKKDFDEFNSKTNIPDTDVKKTELEINSTFFQKYKKLSKLPLTATTRILTIAKFLFKYFLVFEKIKTLNFEVRDLDGFTALVIPKNYQEKAKKNLESQFSDIKTENSDLVDEISIGLKYKKLNLIKNYTDPKSYNQEHFDAWHYIYLENYFIKALNSLFLFSAKS